MNVRLACAALLVAAALACQDAPAPDAQLPEQLKELHTMASNPKLEDDFRAIGLLQKLAEGFDKRNPKDQEKIAKAVADVFRAGKVRPADKDHLYRKAGEVLAVMGEDGGKELQKVLLDPRIKDKEFIPLRAALIVDLGKTADEKQVDWLLEQARRSPIDDILAAAAEALGNYTKLEPKHRREVVKELLVKYGEVESKGSVPDNNDPKAQIDFSGQDARKTLSKCRPKWNATLTALTGQGFSAFADWQRWLNKNPNWSPPK
ncbi:MAG TPA: hypothetical protein VK348_14055 [Planctomycetota bacterium]|nr:hypothetical protein [Planctomycetota bacterium]